MRHNAYFVQSADFDEKINLESSPPNETPSSHGACERQNLDYFIALICSCDVGGTSAISKESADPSACLELSLFEIKDSLYPSPSAADRTCCISHYKTQ